MMMLMSEMSLSQSNRAMGTLSASIDGQGDDALGECTHLALKLGLRRRESLQLGKNLR